MNRVYLHDVAHMKKQGNTLYVASEGEGVVDEKSVVATRLRHAATASATPKPSALRPPISAAVQIVLRPDLQR